ncbi:MAG: hypothetical protein DDT38_01450 [Firmicutes bacterium]|nr:hypothetical protein [candidate division NPL-UPA2 bacterium]
MMLKKLPYPIAGLMLGLASLGNLLLSYGAGYRYAIGALSALILLALIVKTISYPKDLIGALQQMPVAAVLPTFSMGMSLLAGYLRPHWLLGAQFIWWSALFIHIALLVSFSLKHAFPFSVKKVLPSWFIPYVGIAIFSVTAPAFGQRSLGQMVFWFGLVAYFVLLPAVLYRIFVVKEIPPALLPTTAILAAPSSLTLVGYLNSFPERNLAIVLLLLICTLLSYLIVAFKLPQLLTLPFAPSFSAFTFPLVIAGVAVKVSSAFLTQHGQAVAPLSGSVVFFEIVAVAMVAYVVYRYGVFIFTSPAPAKPANPR